MTLEQLRKNEDIINLCKKEKIKKMSVFGSVSRGETTEKSDIDLLVEFDGTQTLFQIVRIKQELETKLKTKVDLVTKDALSKYFRDDVLKESKVIYEN